jgi:hypothetical protein
MANSNTRLFAPKSYAIRQPTDNARRNGAVLNPPRLPEIGGMTKSNGDQRESSMTIRKPGGTR